MADGGFSRQNEEFGQAGMVGQSRIPSPDLMESESWRYTYNVESKYFGRQKGTACGCALLLITYIQRAFLKGKMHEVPLYGSPVNAQSQGQPGEPGLVIVLMPSLTCPWDCVTIREELVLQTQGAE